MFAMFCHMYYIYIDIIQDQQKSTLFNWGVPIKYPITTLPPPSLLDCDYGIYPGLTIYVCVCMCICMCICKCICICMCMFMCMCMYMYACLDVCMYVCMHACRYVCMYVCMYVCVYARMHVCTYACMRVCMHACIYLTATTSSMSQVKQTPLHRCHPLLLWPSSLRAVSLMVGEKVAGKVAGQEVQKACLSLGQHRQENQDWQNEVGRNSATHRWDQEAVPRLDGSPFEHGFQPEHTHRF